MRKTLEKSWSKIRKPPGYVRIFSSKCIIVIKNAATLFLHRSYSYNKDLLMPNNVSLIKVIWKNWALYRTPHLQSKTTWWRIVCLFNLPVWVMCTNGSRLFLFLLTWIRRKTLRDRYVFYYYQTIPFEDRWVEIITYLMLLKRNISLPYTYLVLY